MINALIIISIGLLILAFITASAFIYIYIMKTKIKKLEKQNAEKALELLKDSYDLHLLARKKHYEAKLDNDVDMMNKCKEAYEKSISNFKDPTVLCHKKYFSEHGRSEFDEILEKPLYNLI